MHKMLAPKEPSSVLFEIIVGCYEEFVMGYQLIVDEVSHNAKLLHTFATHSHRASVRSVASRGKFVVSGGADETINIYDMSTRKECGMLMENNGTITSVSFTPDCSHLISTSEDGSIKIFRQGSWQLEKVWPSAHKGAGVTWLSVHPTGKMALSVGKDHTLRTWNLVKGRPAYTINLYSRCRQLECVVWSPGGTMFAVPMDSRIEINSMETGGVLKELKLSSKVATCLFLTDQVVCAGEASGNILACSTESGKQLWLIVGEGRIKGLGYLDNHLVTASSNGCISVYSLVDVTVTPQLLCSVNTDCRITCLTLYDFKKANVKNSAVKQQRAVHSDEGKKIMLIHESSKSAQETSSRKKLKTSDIVCCPKNQHWVVEDGKKN